MEKPTITIQHYAVKHILGKTLQYVKQ